MKTTPEKIDEWRRASVEHQQLEFKEAKNQFDNKKLFRYCVAIANEGGGHLLLGVEDNPPRNVTGTQAFRDPISMSSKLFDSIGFRVDIEEVIKNKIESKLLMDVRDNLLPKLLSGEFSLRDAQTQTEAVVC